LEENLVKRKEPLLPNNRPTQKKLMEGLQFKRRKILAVEAQGSMRMILSL
jgi:hypothetical protein